MKISLNFAWDFVPDFKKSYLKSFPKDSEKIDIPHSTVRLPANYFNEKDYQKITTYRKCFDVKKEFIGKKIFINFDGLMSIAHIYLNGKKLGDFVSAYLPFKVDISEFVKEKNNELIVVLDSTENKDIPPFGYAIDYLTFGGIYRKVTLEIRPQIYIDNVFIRAHANGDLKVQTTIANSIEPFDVIYELYYDNLLVKKFTQNELKIDDVKVWDTTHPNLYKLRVILKANGEKDIQEIMFGFRDVEFKKDGFFLNGERIKLIGLNRHQSYPYIGYAASKSLQELDAQILKNKCGVNIVRCSHYPQSEDFLNECDKIGLLVFTETPGWQFVPKDNEKWRNNYRDFIIRMVIKERNHPSVVCYGIRIDESQDDHELYLDGNKIVHDLDDTRQTTGVRNFKNSELLEDFFSYNDFSCSDLSHGLDDPKTVKNAKNKGYLISEYNGHMFPTKNIDNYDKRIQHALRHAKVINDGFKYERIAGTIGWCFADYYTHNDFGSGDHICYHGVMDMNRLPKWASFIYSSQQNNFDVFEVLSNIQPGDRDEALFDKTYIATNADYVEMYSNKTLIGKYYPDKKEFGFLPHPPIIIEDYIGETFIEDGISKKDSKKISKVLSYVAIHGYSRLKLSHYISLGSFMVKYKKGYSDLVNYWNKYVSSWGGELKVYTFKAYKNGKLIGERKIGQASEYNLIIDAPKTELKNEETYDTLKIDVTLEDNYGNRCYYANDALQIITDGPIEILSPKLISLNGGTASIYVRSLNKKGKAKLKIISSYDEHEIEILVK